jgi:hypothetical protein
MKINTSGAVAPFLAVSYLLSLNLVHADKSTYPSVPVGWLSANPGIVKAGAKPELKWNITYPATVIDYVTVTDGSTVTAKQELEMEVRVLGAGVTASSSNSSKITFVPTEAKMSYNGASYQRLFYGSNPEVDPTKVVFRSTAKAGEPVRFGGRYYYNGSWGQFHYSSSGTRNVRTLVNGQTPPTTYPLHTAPTLENFIKPYLDASGKVMIGPMDVIVFMELTHSDAQADQQGYDLQDMVLLVTFKQKS